MPRLVALVVGIGLVLTGAYAFLSPRGFYDNVAEYPPYNEHFLHDIGSFLIGLGAALLLAWFVADALLLALAGNAVGATFHAISHIEDRDLGGAATDPWLLSALALVLIAATVLRRRAT